MSGPAVSSCAAGTLYVFGVGADGRDWQRSFSGAWSTWHAVGGAWGSDPAAVCQPSTTTTDLFQRGADAGVWQLAVTT